MSITGCFRAKIATGRVDVEAGKAVLDWLEAYKADYADKVAANEAVRMAAKDAATRAIDMAEKETARAMRDMAVRVEILERSATYEASVHALANTKGDFGFGNKAPVTTKYGFIPVKVGSDDAPAMGYGIRSILARDVYDILPGGMNVYHKARILRGEAHSLFREVIERLKPTMAGLKSDAVLDEQLGRAVVDGANDAQPLARAMAVAWKNTDEHLVKRFNDAGGNIAARDRYLPQRHDTAKVKAAQKQQWIDFTRGLLDLTQMVDRVTGEPLSPARLNEVLGQVYDTISRDGVDEAAPNSGFRPAGLLADKGADARILHFKDFESWQSYRERFGDGSSIFELMTHHIETMSRDIALLELTGSNTGAMRRFIENMYEKKIAAIQGNADINNPGEMAATIKQVNKAINALKRDRDFTLSVFDDVTGQSRIAVDSALARFMSNTRAWLSSAQLGSAVISAISDNGTLAATARLNDLPVTQVLARATAYMADGTSEITAAQFGFVADTLMQGARQTDTYMGETIATGLASQVSTAVMRVQGLRKWTAAARNAFGMEYLAQITNKLGLDFDALPEKTLAAFRRYGINADDWNAIRNTAPREVAPGALMLNPMDIKSRAASEKLRQMINTQMDYAVIEADPLSRAYIQRGTRPGTVQGEVLRAIGQYKTFPVTMMMMHFGRALSRGWDGGRLSHAALTFSLVWVLGAAAMQAKEITQGREPLSLDPSTEVGRKAWLRALLQSGGLGIYGDLLGQDKTRYGNSWAATLAGPTVGMAESVLGQFLLKNITLTAQGKETHFAGDALYIGARYLPGQSLWYARLAFQREVVDQMALMIDERAPERMRKLEEKAMQDWNQSFFSPPGSSIFRRN